MRKPVFLGMASNSFSGLRMASPWILRLNSYPRLLLHSSIRLLILTITGFSVNTLAGPPFQTDDPEPVEYRHVEVYVASQGSFEQDETSLTAPHVELNYGLLPNVQIHLLAPFEFVKQAGDPSHYGFGDVELGAKLR